MRAHPESVVIPAPRPQPAQQQADSRPALALVIAERDVPLYVAGPFRALVAHTTSDALAVLGRERPPVAAVDWDAEQIDGPEICRTASQFGATSVLVMTGSTGCVPAALKAGCHAVLLKPFAPNLLYARIGRLLRETSHFRKPPRALAPPRDWGTNRAWPSTACPHCGTTGATSFDFSSYRRMWYACLSCEHVWLGPRQE